MLPDQAAQKFVEEVDEIMLRYKQRKTSPAIQDMEQQIEEHERAIVQLRSDIAEQTRAATTKTIAEIRTAASKHEHHSEHGQAIESAANRLIQIIGPTNHAPVGIVENYLKNYFQEKKRREEEKEYWENCRIIVF